MKRVLLVIGSPLENAGVPNVVMKIVRTLHNEFLFDVLVGNSKPGYFDEEFLSYGGNIYRYNKYTYEDGKIKFIKGGKQIYTIVSKILKETRYDIIHCHNGYLAGWVMKVAYKQNVPIRIAHSHGTYLINGKNIPARIFKKQSMKKIVRYSTDYLACSNIAGKTLFLGHDFINVLNPIDAARYLALKKQQHDGIHLLQIGYYCTLKNQLFTLKVLKELIDKEIDAHLWYIGYENESGYLQKLKNKINDLNLNDRVELLPSNYDKESIFPIIDFMLLPSSSEGLPLTALEAQASKTFCIASTHVPMDADMGLFTRLDVDSTDSALYCAEWILRNNNYPNTLDTEKIMSLNTEQWASMIAKVYRQ